MNFFNYHNCIFICVNNYSHAKLIPIIKIKALSEVIFLLYGVKKDEVTRLGTGFAMWSKQNAVSEGSFVLFRGTAHTGLFKFIVLFVGHFFEPCVRCSFGRNRDGYVLEP